VSAAPKIEWTRGDDGAAGRTPAAGLTWGPPGPSPATTHREGCHVRVIALTSGMRRWQAVCHVGRHGGVRDRPGCAAAGWSWAHAECQGCGDRRTAASADGAPASGRPAALYTRRPDCAGHTGEAATARALAGLSGDAVHPTALASHQAGQPPASSEKGMLPLWAKDAKRASNNARAETVHEKPTFRKAFLEQAVLGAVRRVLRMVQREGGRREAGQATVLHAS
jgi:hypothetical protein